MFGKDKVFRSVLFSAEVIEAAMQEFVSIQLRNGDEIRSRFVYSSNEDESDTIRDSEAYQRRNAITSSDFTFIASAKLSSAQFTLKRIGYDFIFTLYDVDSLANVERIVSHFNNAFSSSKVPIDEALKKITVFVGHGRSLIWRDLKSHLQDLHGINIVAYETGARAGFTIKEVLEELTSEASFALLVHTGEDIDKDGKAHARENVVHETGLFQGKLGFRRAIVLLEDDCSEFSNIAGLQQLRFSKGSIRETYGDVLAILRREFSSRG